MAAGGSGPRCVPCGSVAPQQARAREDARAEVGHALDQLLDALAHDQALAVQEAHGRVGTGLDLDDQIAVERELAAVEARDEDHSRASSTTRARARNGATVPGGTWARCMAWGGDEEAARVGAPREIAARSGGPSLALCIGAPFPHS